MLRRCSWMLLLLIVAVTAESLATGLMEDVSKADQAMRPKAKRVQELLMFGNQQNRRADNIPGATGSNSYTPNAEKRTLGTSGLEDVKVPPSSSENFVHKMPSNQIYSDDGMAPYENNYEYGKVMSSDVSSRNWDIPLYYPRYYTLGGEEDRRKRGSEKSAITSSSSSPTTSTSTTTTTTTTSPPLTAASIAPTRLAQEPLALPERSAMAAYQEPRYKRGLDHEELLTLLSFLENSPRNTNWRNYANDEYDNMEDDRGVMGLEEENPRDDWMAVETPRHFASGMHSPQAVSAFDIGIPRTHPVNSYDQYETQYGAPYESTQYGAAQYGSLYPSQSYYSPEKRFLVARKRSQMYDTYNSRDDLSGLSRLMGSQVYPNYPHRIVY